jgi:hypothetical protein
MPFCVKCGEPTRDAHHIFGKRALSTRWDLDNGLGLCAFCHVFDRYGFEQNPYLKENMDIVIGRLGEKGFEELQKRAKQTVHWTLDDYLEREKELKEIWKQYER